MIKYSKFLLFIFIINFFDILSVNFDKIGVRKIVFVNDNANDYALDIYYNLFNTKKSSIVPQIKNLTLKSKSEFYFDIEKLQENFDRSTNKINCTEDDEELKKILSCVKNIDIKNVFDNSKPKLCVSLSEDQILKIQILSKKHLFDIFYVTFDQALRSKECYDDCINNIYKRYPNGGSTNGYKLALGDISPQDFLERMKLLNEIYFLPDFSLRNIKPDSKARIPKNFFQIWIGEKPIPEKYQEYQQKWRSVLSNDWTYKLYTDKDVEKMEFSSEQSKTLYYSLPNKVAQSDLLRMEILNKYGGVYVDIDTEPYESIDFLVHTFDFFCLLYGPSYGNLFIDTYFIGAISNHPVIKQVIYNMISLFLNSPDLSDFIKSSNLWPNLMTSILPLTRAVYEKAGYGGMRDVILPIKYFDNHFTSIFAYGTHYPNRSWKK